MTPWSVCVRDNGQGLDYGCLFMLLSTAQIVCTLCTWRRRRVSLPSPTTTALGTHARQPRRDGNHGHATLSCSVPSARTHAGSRGVAVARREVLVDLRVRVVRVHVAKNVRAQVKCTRHTPHNATPQKGNNGGEAMPLG
jgi:hypothetical protein